MLIPKQSKMKAIFFDRDGTINLLRMNDYVKCWEEFIFMPQAKEAIKRLSTSKDMKIIVVTNQAGIGKGLMSEDDLLDIHGKMVSEISSYGGRIDAIYYCPHTQSDDCGCRKPKTGLLIRAASENNIDLAESFFIGDSKSDIEVAYSVGCCPVLVINGQEYTGLASRDSADKLAAPEFIAESLLEAADWITTACQQPVASSI